MDELTRNIIGLAIALAVCTLVLYTLSVQAIEAAHAQQPDNLTRKDQRNTPEAQYIAVCTNYTGSVIVENVS